MELYFRAENPLEEHAIASRFLCPNCKGETDLERQELISEEGRTFTADRLVRRCKKCQEEYTLTFYLPPDYDPLKFGDKLFGRR